MKKIRIMIVEDESIVGRDIRNMLLGLGYEVSTVISTYHEAIKRIKNIKPDLVLMDIMLHGKPAGIEAAGKIYNVFNIPVVYLSAYADKKTLMRAKKTLPFGYILKPFEERELQTTIEIALYKFKMEKKLKEREQWFFTILKSFAEAVIVTDKKGKISFLNSFAERITEWKQEGALNKPLNNVLKLMNKTTRKVYNYPINKILNGENSHIPNETILISKSGKGIYVDQKATPIIKNNQGNISGIVFTLTDISRRIKTEKELKKSWQNQRTAMRGVVQAMALIIETRDPYTAGHQCRVTKLACRIAEEMNLSKERIEGLRLAGELHDIGKIHVPAEILSKPGNISEAEFNIIKTHPKVGYDILKSINFPWPIAKIVLQHHERYDGSGYPSGLTGEQIILEAKILAVADVIEAMASHRPYRPALSIDTALEEINKNKGILYDPDVVDACLKVFEKSFKFE